jgi:acetoin utilization deacetylase AcuC-like enzyme
MIDERLSMPVVWTTAHRMHDPGGEVWVGVRIPGTEVLERAEVIYAALADVAATFVDPGEHGIAPIAAVHSHGLLDYLEHAYERWIAAGLDREPGQDRVVPYVFPLPQLMGGRGLHTPAAPSALAGWYAMDTTTLIGPGTFEAACAAAGVALTAVDLVLDGARAAYGACRPPGHHAGTGFFGGSCYLNNAAIAAQALSDGGVDSIAIVDLDAHHGNGTQEIFYERADVFYGSVHADPGVGNFPHFVGYEDEVGAGPGRGHNLNMPLPSDAETDVWLEAVSAVIDRASTHRPQALVVSLGVDGWRADPEGPLQVGEEGFSAAGELLAALGIPTVFVQEGGYDLEQLGTLVSRMLIGFERGRST